MLIQTATALSKNSSIFSSNIDFWEFILIAISLFVLVAWIFSTMFILWWGLLLILSWWKDDKIKPAINTIRYAVIGIVVTVLTIFLFPVFWKLLWLNVEKYAKPKRIFEKIEEIWDKIFWGSSSYSIDDNSNIDTIDVDFSDL